MVMRSLINLYDKIPGITSLGNVQVKIHNTLLLDLEGDIVGFEEHPKEPITVVVPYVKRTSKKVPYIGYETLNYLFYNPTLDNTKEITAARLQAEQFGDCKFLTAFASALKKSRREK